MPKLTQDQITTIARKIGLRAILKDPKAKLYAEVNHEDNFALVMGRVAHNAIMDEACARLDDHDAQTRNSWRDWFNAQVDKSEEHNTKLYALCRELGREAYKQLRKP